MKPIQIDSPTDGYDRNEASRVLAGLAFPRLLPEAGTVAAEVVGGRRRIEYRVTALTPEPGSHLTTAQRGYLNAYMRPCAEDQVTSAGSRVLWNDSDGLPNVAYAGPGRLGPEVAIVARETTLALWRSLATNETLAAAITNLDEDARRVLAASTTDQEPLEIFRIGVEATSRTLVQHAGLADQTPYRTPADFARGLRDSGIFGVVAGTWYWELQASTFRRGLIPVSFVTQPDGSVRYSGESLSVLRLMKAATIAEARAVMLRATTEEGLTVHEAVRRYHHDLDVIAKQYALLGDAEQPRCLALMTNTVGEQRFSVLPGVVNTFVETFVRLLDLVDLVAVTGDADQQISDPRERRFRVPDMTCQHCRATISGVLESMDIGVEEVDLETKLVVADFRTTSARERAFDAIRDAGYTVVPPGSR